MNNSMRKFLSGTIAGCIVAGTSAIALVVGEGPGGTALQLSDITSAQWLAVGLGGGLASLKDWKTLLAQPEI